MNISKPEQRTLHVLARGGAVLVEKDDKGKIVEVNCVSREGWTLADCTLGVFRKLRKRRLVASSAGGPYRITRAGRVAVRPQLDNRS
ncbi:MAG: YjhX family toxin [Pseudomonadota bacterium]